MPRLKVEADFLLYAARAVRHFADGYVAVLFPIYLVLMGFSAFQVGVISAASLLGSAALTLGASTVAQKCGLRATLVGFAGLMVATGVSLALLPYTWPLFITAFIGTINPSAGNNSVFVPLEHAALAASVPDERRTFAFATYSTSGAVAAALGALSAALADYVSGPGLSLTDAIRCMFLGYAGFGLLAGVLYSMLPVHEAPVPQSARGSGLGPSRQRIYKLSTLFALDSFASGFAVQSLVTVWLVTQHGMSASTAGVFFFWTNLLSAASLPIAGRLGTRIGLINTMVWTHAPANVLLILAALAPNLTWALGFLLAKALLSSMDTPARASYVMAIVSPPERAAAAGFTNAPRSFAAGISPAIAGLLMTACGGAVTLIVCGVLKITYDGLLLLNFGRVRPPEEQRG